MDNFAYFLKGAFSGMCGLVISHPFDTIKTNIQDGKHVSLNPRALYRGLLPPLFGVGLEKAIVFGTYTNTHNYLSQRMNSDLSIPISGAVSGLTASLVVTPVERLKIIMQTGNKFNVKYLRPTSLYRGLSATFTRETPGFAIYFTTYNGLKSKFYKDKEITSRASFLFGGFSGGFAWIFIYPQDLIKTQMQSERKHMNRSLYYVTKDFYKKKGLKAFYTGFRFALMRAVPLHGGTFMTMEMINKYF